jgi:protein-S-isoprenylcysteine O-methyltransferase Ste14
LSGCPCRILSAFGGLLTWLGLGLLWGSWFVLALTAVLALIVHLFVVLYEEQSLSKRFGVSYDQYRLRVRRWLPHLRALTRIDSVG